MIRGCLDQSPLCQWHSTSVIYVSSDAHEEQHPAFSTD
jgi:hypothetical protein